MPNATVYCLQATHIMSQASQAVQLLQASIDEDDESYFRFMVDGKFVKYVTIAPGVWPADDMCFAPALIPLLPAFPTGDWNDGYIARNPTTGQAFFAGTTKRQFPGIRNIWHSMSVDHLELVFGEKLRSGVYEVTSPRFEGTVVAKFARFSWEIDYLEDETVAYSWIDGYSIGPKFLGHLTEEGRVIGFLIELLSSSRHAGPGDLELCQAALSKIHRLGIVHGDVNKHNFLIQDGQATLIDFDGARKTEDISALEEEMNSLPAQLSDSSGKGGCIAIADGM